MKFVIGIEARMKNFYTKIAENKNFNIPTFKILIVNFILLFFKYWFVLFFRCWERVSSALQNGGFLLARHRSLVYALIKTSTWRLLLKLCCLTSSNCFNVTRNYKSV